MFRHIALVRSANFIPTIGKTEVGLADLLALMAISVPLYVFCMAVFGAPTKAFADILASFLSIFFLLVAAVLVTLFYRGEGPESVMSSIFLALISAYLVTLMIFSLNLFLFPASGLSYLGRNWVPNRVILSFLYALPALAFLWANTRRVINETFLETEPVKRTNAWYRATAVGCLVAVCTTYFIWQTIFFAEDPGHDGWNGTLVKIIEIVGGRLGIGA